MSGSRPALSHRGYEDQESADGGDRGPGQPVPNRPVDHCDLRIVGVENDRDAPSDAPLRGGTLPILEADLRRAVATNILHNVIQRASAPPSFLHDPEADRGSLPCTDGNARD